MPSLALQNWRNERLPRLDDLLSTHEQIRQPWRPGIRRRMKALNAALVLRLAAEFQGFARDLHNEAADVFASWIAPESPALQGVARDGLTDGRDLDRGNAHPGAIGRDFGKFGLRVWTALELRDRHTTRHNRSLDQLNAARNALAHSDDARLAALRASGCRLVLRTIRHWLRDLDTLAGNLDKEIAEWLAQSFSRESPW
jgi:hypothetical protein